MKKKVIIGIVIVIIILVILIVIGTMVFNSAENVYDNMLNMGETGSIEDYSEDYIIGIGTITSFNIEVLDTTFEFPLFLEGSVGTVVLLVISFPEPL